MSQNSNDGWGAFFGALFSIIGYGIAFFMYFGIPFDGM